MRRPEDWPQRLAKALADSRWLAFEWNANDCCTFPANLIEAITEPGVDLMKDFRDRYLDEAGALDFVIQYGGSMEGAAQQLAADHGLVEQPPSYAKGGDLVYLHDLPQSEPFGGSMGIVMDHRVALMGRAGLTAISRRLAARSWVI